MKLLFFDIETYQDFFCFCSICYDSETHKELWRKETHSDFGTGIVDGTNLSVIMESFADADYIISYNGSKFDIPILAKIKHDITRMGQTTDDYIHADGDLIIMGNDDGSHMIPRHNVKEWTAKHFDLLNNCLLAKSLKQWEMYCNLPIRELPYAPTEKLTDDMRKEILDYCFHDVWATSEVYWRFGSGEKKTKYHTLRARKAILERAWPSNLPFRFDRSAQAVAAGIIYETNAPIAPKTTNPLNLFKLDEFDVPDEVKNIIRKLARSFPKTDKERKELAKECVYNGIQFGKGGCHYIKKGHVKGIYCFDVQSEYPRIIRHWGLLKTPTALANWSQRMNEHPSQSPTAA